MAERRHIADAAMPSVVMEGFAVVYHAASGATHLLASPVPEILAAIAPDRGAATLDEIVARLRADYDMDGGDAADVAAVVAERLDELTVSGLVRAA
ncbi:HPr-rel-A system PqqD family peptide chaperone [Sphingomonas arantia]|uniref:HPr-rel-A system PqqD family peptide chaperone n=1 Tax=Sphingomonas arantia TaxID=1460676 RepID=A0ABW4U024_9SPHN